MRVGDSVTQKVTCLAQPIVTVPETNVFLEPDTDDCCFELPAFADAGSDDILKNDTPSFLKGFESSTTAVLLFLTKPADPGFADIPLVDDTLGTFSPLGFFIDSLNRSYIGFQYDFKAILAAHGQGTYQIRHSSTTIIGPGTPGVDFAYCLKQFTDERADGTIRINFQNSFLLYDKDNFTDRISFPLNWQNQIRLEGWFGGNNSDYEKTFTKFRDQSERTVQDKRIPGYRMRIDLAPAVVHDMIASEVLQADLKDITDYNQNNPWGHRTTPVRDPSEYKPTDTETELRMTVTVEWKALFDTGLKKHC